MSGLYSFTRRLALASATCGESGSGTEDQHGGWLGNGIDLERVDEGIMISAGSGIVIEELELVERTGKRSIMHKRARTILFRESGRVCSCAGDFQLIGEALSSERDCRCGGRRAIANLIDTASISSNEFHNANGGKPAIEACGDNSAVIDPTIIHFEPIYVTDQGADDKTSRGYGKIVAVCIHSEGPTGSIDVLGALVAGVELAPTNEPTGVRWISCRCSESPSKEAEAAVVGGLPAIVIGGICSRILGDDDCLGSSDDEKRRENRERFGHMKLCSFSRLAPRGT